MPTELREVHLHGALRRFGRSFRLAVATPAEAVRALCVQVPGLRAALREGFYRVTTGPRGRRRDRDEDGLTVGFGGPLHIVPVVAGAGGGKGLGWALAIAGVALLGAAFAAPLLLGGGLLAGASIGGISATTVGLVGASLALQGVSMLLAPKVATPGSAGADTGDKMDSFLFGGAPDRPVTGRPVPVGFGTFLVLCTPISFQLKNIRLS